MVLAMIPLRGLTEANKLLVLKEATKIYIHTIKLISILQLKKANQLKATDMSRRNNKLKENMLIKT